MAFSDLSAEIEELFREPQERYERAITHLAVYGGRRRAEGQGGRGDGRSVATRPGFRTFDPYRKRPNRKASPARLATKRESEQERMDAIIRARLLAGERPKMGGRGRPATRWFRIAFELGIDLLAAPVTS
jgi:hypothetical protein